MARFVITGTGTDVGKTVFAAGLCGLIGAQYWKPVQSGLAGNTPNDGSTGRVQAAHSLPQQGTDAAEVARLSGAIVHPEGWLLREALSPHRAAELEGIEIDIATLTPPKADPLVIEGAGGVLVPVTRRALFADIFSEWQIPVVLVAATGLGTISHSLTALESLRARNVPVHGVAFVGGPNDDNIATIGQIGGVRVLGHLPQLDRLGRETLSAAMAAKFSPEDFQ